MKHKYRTYDRRLAGELYDFGSDMSEELSEEEEYSEREKDED